MAPPNLALAIDNEDQDCAVGLIESGVDINVRMHSEDYVGDGVDDDDDDDEMDLTGDDGSFFSGGDSISDNGTMDEDELYSVDADEGELDEPETATTYLHRAVAKNLIRVATALLDKDASLVLRIDPV